LRSRVRSQTLFQLSGWVSSPPDFSYLLTGVARLLIVH
jgi:hypothetical protein